ncbi:MAG: Beta-barrel assembly-enhancing protease [Planctomycetes bacterium]|nr:Beta-barrel assembly-enhancing protease [Planctomycetota bacterium]
MNGLVSLDLFDFGILLQALSNNLKVGVLAVRSEGRAKYLEIDRNKLIRVLVKKPRVSMEKVLWNYRAVEKAPLRQAIEAVEKDPSEGPLARWLVSRGVTTPAQVRRAAIYQAVEEVLEIFYWKNVGFEFYGAEDRRVQEDPTLVAVGEPVDVDSLLLQCTKIIDDIAKFNEVTPSLRDVYELQIPSLESLERLVPDPIEREFILLIDGVRDMREVLRDMRLNRYDALECFYRFRTRGWLRPKNSFELLMLAENRRGEFPPEKRARVLERVNELGVEGFQIVLPLAEVYEQIGATDKAAQLFARQAQRCREAKDAAGAVQAVRRAVKLMPDDLDLRDLEVTILEEAGSTADAAAALLSVASLRASRGNVPGARASARRAVRLAPAEASAWKLLADLDEQTGRKRRSAYAHRRAGDALHAAGQLDAAIDRYRRAQTLCPGGWSVRFRLAELLQRTGRGDLAIQALSEQIGFVLGATGWNDPSARLGQLRRIEARFRESGGLASSAATQLGRAYAQIGERDLAVSFFRECAETLTRAGRHRGAVAALDEILEIDPSDHAARRLLARAHVASGDGTRALSHLRRLSGYFMSVSRFHDAREAYEEMLRVDPACPDAHRGLARALLYLNETDRAAEHYHRVGLIYRGYGQPAEAAPYLREAVERRPADAELLEEYCELLLGTGKTDEALRALSALVDVRMAQGSPARAAIALTRILEIDQRYPGARAILQEAARQLLRLAEDSEEISAEEGRRLMEEARAVAAASGPASKS